MAMDEMMETPEFRTPRRSNQKRNCSVEDADVQGQKSLPPKAQNPLQRQNSLPIKNQNPSKEQSSLSAQEQV